MWKVALGVVVFFQAGILRAGEEEAEPDADAQESVVHVGCPPANEGSRAASSHDCVAEEVFVATPAAVAASVPSQTARATLSFRNDVGKKFRLVEARFTMDGAELPTVLTATERGKSYIVLSGSVKPGHHVVTARLTYQGERRVFNYMKGYKLNVTSDQVLTALENRPVSFTIVGAENPGLTVALDKTVVVKVEESTR